MNPEAAFISGELALPSDPASRLAITCEVAGALAELGVQSLDITDPRACRSWTLSARTADLPRTMMEAAPGTTLVCPQGRLQLTESRMHWYADPSLSNKLRALSS
jgi:hypothetical protein